jgi:hypothetical protein
MHGRKVLEASSCGEQTPKPKIGKEREKKERKQEREKAMMAAGQLLCRRGDGDQPISRAGIKSVEQSIWSHGAE